MGKYKIFMIVSFILLIILGCSTISNAIEIKHVLQIDTYLDNAKYGIDGIHIEGWKLATEKDTKLEVYLDNTKVEDKYITYSRKYALTSIIRDYGTEVENPQPHYDIDIPTENLSDKTYKLQIRFVRKNGEILDKVEKNIIIDKQIKHALQIDTNLNDAKYGIDGIHIEGWKLATEKDTKLEVYMDNTKVEDKYITYSRKYALTSIIRDYGTEVENPQPHYDIDIPTENLSDKTYKLQISFVRKNGEVLEKVEKNIVINKNIKYLLQIDTNLNNAKFEYEGIHIEGWKLATEKDTKLEVYMDNIKVEDKYITYSRKYALTSIVKGYGTEEENPQPHYNIDIPNGIIPDGEHVIKIELVTKRGKVLQKVENSISTNSKFFQIHIESIYDRNTITNEEHILSGWLMTNSNRQNIKLMIDGQYQNNEFERSKRQDVNKYFNNIFSEQNPTAGFSTKIDFSKLSIGLHQIAIRVFDENNIKYGEVVIYVFNEPAKNRFNVDSIDTAQYPGYKEKIADLMQKHKDWDFKILYTGLTFEEVVRGECSVHSRNLVPTNYGGEWVCSVCGTKLYDSGWYCASEKAVAYYMDPRNFLDENNVFQFLELNEYTSDSVSLNGIQNKVNGSFLNNYAESINNACNNTNVNPYYIIARLIQEQGYSGTTIGKGMDGGDGKTYYNPFNIGASGNGYDQIYANALETAKSYGWDSMQKAIEGGISFCKKNWLENYQNTLYQNKFDIDTTNGSSLYTHQYMQNLMGAYSEAKTLKSMYTNTGKVDSQFTFIIPVYEKMSTTVAELPSNNTETSPMNFKVVANGGLNLRSEASADSSVIKLVPNGEIVLSVQRGINSNWQKVMLNDGTIGFMSGTYLQQVADVTNCNYSAYVKTADGSGCYIRVGPSTRVDRVTVLTDGTWLTVINEGTYNNIDGYNWVRIMLPDGRQAFMPSKYLAR